MIHNNIYSKRVGNIAKTDPYIYDFTDEKIIESFVMFFSKYYDGYIFVTQSLFDYCETKRSYISDYTKQIIESGSKYVRNIFMYDIRSLFESFKTDDILDFLDICINNSNIIISSQYTDKKLGALLQKYAIDSQQHSFIDRLNELFEHNNLGYYIINNVIETKESDYLHQEVICKSLSLLVKEDFKGSIGEFDTAIKDYTEKDYESAIINSCKAFESTMKAILDKLTVTFIMIKLLQEI